MENIENSRNLPQDERFSCHEKMDGELPMPPVNPSDIDKSHIILGKRIRKKTRATNLDPSALIATFNVFMIGKAKDVQKYHQSELPPPPSNWRELRNHPHSQEFRDAMLVEYDTLVAKNKI